MWDWGDMDKTNNSGIDDARIPDEQSARAVRMDGDGIQRQR